MAYDIAGDVRLDPRIKALLAAVPSMTAKDADSRETMLAEASTPTALKGAEEFRQVMELCDTEELAPSKGLHIHTEQIVSQPDGNTINLQVIRPETDETVACVYYIHGGGMMTLSCYDGMYRAWGKVIAANGVAVVMVDFRNALSPSSAPEVAPFPAGLNDCLSGLHWVVATRHGAQHRPGAHRGGRRERGRQPDPGHRAQAQAGRRSRPGQGLYALCPYIAGRWPLPENPSSTENNGILLDLHNNRGAMAYGIEQLEAENPLAWPSFATVEDVTGFPPTVINVNECDPLRDEGINFYRKLLEAGVAARAGR
jgi:acetyl esterase